MRKREGMYTCIIEEEEDNGEKKRKGGTGGEREGAER